MLRMPTPPTDPAGPSRTGPALRLGLLAGLVALAVGMGAMYAGSGGSISVVEALLVIGPFALLVTAIVAAKVYSGKPGTPPRR